MISKKINKQDRDIQVLFANDYARNKYKIFYISDSIYFSHN